MAEGNVLRELIAKIGFRVDESGFKKAEGAISGLKGMLLKMGALLASGAVVAGIGKLVKEFADAGDEAVKASQKTGVTIKTYQRLAYAAGMADVSHQSLATGLKFLSKNMIAAEEGGKGAAEAFKDLGISPKKYLNDTEGLLGAVADKFQKMPDGPKKVATAVKLLGRAGTELIPLLNQGSKAIHDLGDEAEAFGLVIDDVSAKTGEEFNDNLRRMRGLIRGIAFSFARELLPYFNKALVSFLDWMKVNREFIRLTIDRVFTVLGYAVQALWNNLKFLYNIGEKIVDAFINIVKHLTKTTDGTWALVAAVAALAIAFGIIEIGPLLIAALGAAIILLVDDVQSYLDGKPSFLAPLYDKAVPVFQKLHDLWKTEFGIMEDIWDVATLKLGEGFQFLGEKIRWAFGIKALQDFEQKLEGMQAVLNPGGALKKFFNFEAGAFGNANETVREYANDVRAAHGKETRFKGGFVGDKDESKRPASSAAAENAVNIFNKIASEIKKPKGGGGPSAAPALGAPGVVNRNSTYNVSQKIDVNVTTDADPKGIADKTAETVKKMFNDIVFSTGRASGAAGN